MTCSGACDAYYFNTDFTRQLLREADASRAFILQFPGQPVSAAETMAPPLVCRGHAWACRLCCGGVPARDRTLWALLAHRKLHRTPYKKQWHGFTELTPGTLVPGHAAAAAPPGGHPSGPRGP